jgi:hypothetical protein
MFSPISLKNPKTQNEKPELMFGFFVIAFPFRGRGTACGG